VRTLLLILLFVVWESSADAPASMVDPADGAMFLLIGYGLLVGTMRLYGGRVSRLASHAKLGRRVDRFNFVMGIARGAVPAWFAVGVFALGWRHSVDRVLTSLIGDWAGHTLVTPGVVVGLVPGLFGWMGLWWAQYPVDRTIRERNFLAQLEAELPVFAPPPLASYLVNKLRVQLLFTTVPVLLILMLRDATTVAMRAAVQSGWMHTGWPPPQGVEAVVDFATVALVLLVIPAVLRRVLSTRRLPDGRLREGLTKILDLAGVRCREVLLWDTHNNLGNAAVMGVMPLVRYVMLSDLLLETMTDEQVQAVFAHELGHVHHRHLAWFAGVLGSVLAALSVGSDWVVLKAHPVTTAGMVGWEAGSVVAMIAILWVAYGSLSRWFERQADVYSVRLMQRAGAVGDAAFTSALERVAVVNNIPFDARNWTHGSMAARVSYVYRFTHDPAVELRFDRRTRWMRGMLWLAMLGCATVAATGFARGLGL
jgi:STE24 endopeptidase